MNSTLLSDWCIAFLGEDQVALATIDPQGIADFSGTSYNFTNAEVKAETSIHILSGTINYEFYIPII